MGIKIAVLLNHENQLTDLFKASKICICSKKNKWRIEEIYEKELIEKLSDINLREEIQSVSNKISNCKVVLGTAILGLPYYLLSKLGYELCEADEISLEVLEQIYEDYTKQEEASLKQAALKEEKREVYVSRVPILLDQEGNYFLDLIEIQKQYPSLSSKQIMIPFLTNEAFESLSVVCTHIMPWLDGYLETRGLVAQSRRDDGHYLVKIQHKLCTQNIAYH